MQNRAALIDGAATRANILDRVGVRQPIQWRDNDTASARSHASLAGLQHDFSHGLASGQIAEPDPEARGGGFKDLDAQPLVTEQLPETGPAQVAAPAAPPPEVSHAGQGEAATPAEPVTEGLPAPASAVQGLTPSVMRRIIQWATTSPGQSSNFARTQANLGERGLCFGIGRFCQDDGGLGHYLELCRDIDPEQFTEIFGAGADRPEALADALLDSLTADSREARMAPVGGELLWQAPWVARFKQAARHKPFCNMQFRAAAELVLLPMLPLAARHGLNSERALALLLDRTLNNGAESSGEMLAQLPRGPLDQRLRALAENAANATSTNRPMEILNNPELGDAPLDLENPRME